MKKVLFRTALFLGGLALLMALFGLWFRYQYPPQRLKKMAADAVGERLGRQLDVTDARVNLFKGLELIGVRMSENPDFSAGTFFTADAVRVFPRLVPLVSGQIVVRRVELVRPQIRVHRMSDNTFNFSSLATPSAESSNTPSTGFSPPSLFISDAVIGGGEIFYQDDVANAKVRLSDLEVRVSAFSLTDPFGAKMEANVDLSYGLGHWKGPLLVQGRLSLFGDKAIVLQKFSLGLASSTIDATGTIYPLAQPRLDLAVDLRPLSATELAPLFHIPDPFKNATVSGRWRVNGTSTAFSADGDFKAQSPALDLSGKLSVTGDGQRYTAQLNPTALRLGRNPWAPSLSIAGPLGGQWAVDYTTDKWTIKGSLTGDGAFFSYDGWLNKPAGAPMVLFASAASSGAGEPRFNVDVRSPELVLSSQGPWPGGVKLSGNVGLTGEFQGTPSVVTFRVTADGQSLDTNIGTTFRKPTDSALFLSAEGRVSELAEKPRLYLSSSTTLHTTAGDMSVHGNVQLNQSMDLNMEARLADLSKLQILAPSLSPYRLRGNATVTASVMGPVDHPQIRGNLALLSGSVTPIPGVALSELKGRVVWTQETAELKSLEGVAFGSPFRLGGRVASLSNRPEIVLEGNWEKLDVEKLLKVFSSSAPSAPSTVSQKNPAPAPLARAEGVFHVGEIVHPHYRGRDFYFNWNFTDVGPNLSVLSGTATVTASSGEIINVPVAKKINKLLDRDGSDLGYKKLAGRFLVDRGLAHIPTFTLNSDQTDFFARGQVRLGTMDSDLDLVLKLPAGSVRGSVGQWMTAEDGRPTIEARLKGPLRDPTVKVDYRDTVKRAAQDILKKTLGGWKGKPDRASPPSAQ